MLSSTFAIFVLATGWETPATWAFADFLHTIENAGACKKSAAVWETSGRHAVFKCGKTAKVKLTPCANIN
jgi:hypothetical protein